MPYIILGVLFVIFIQGMLIFRRSFFIKYIRLFLAILIFGFLAISVYYSWLQYNIWQDDDFTKHFLPPYQNINYFLFYAFFRFFAAYLTSLTFGFLFFLVLRSFNKKGGDRFFDEIEPYLCFVAIFLLGHPGWIFYILSLIILYLIIHLFYYFKGLVLSKSGETQNIRLPLYNLWFPLALFVLLMNHFLLSRFFFWDLLSFN